MEHPTLTAEHCGSARTADRNVWQFISTTKDRCPNTGTPPTNLRTGCVLKAKGLISGGSDFRQALIQHPASMESLLQWMGQKYHPATGGVGIHHPSGDA